LKLSAVRNNFEFVSPIPPPQSDSTSHPRPPTSKKALPLHRSVCRPFLHSLELVIFVLVIFVVVGKEERRLVAEEGTLILEDPWEKKRMPVAPATVSSLWAGRGGAAGPPSPPGRSNSVHFYDWEGKYRSFQVRLPFTRQARVLQISLIIIVVIVGCPVED